MEEPENKRAKIVDSGDEAMSADSEADSDFSNSDTEMQSSSSSVPQELSADLVERLLTNIDIWLRVFTFLDLIHRIRVERASKRFASLMLDCWKRQISFDAASVLAALGDGASPEKCESAVVALCAGRIGNCLRSISLVDDVTTDLSLLQIGEACPNVETLHFSTKYYFVSSDLRFKLFANLKTLSFSCSGSLDGHVGMLASVLKQIPSSILRIVRLEGILSEGPFETAAQFEAFFADRPLLEEAVLGCFYTRDGSNADIFRVIGERCPQLKKLQIDVSSAIDMLGIVALSSMKELHLLHSHLRDAEVTVICEHSPNLEALSVGIADNDHPKLDAFEAIAALTNLRHLRIFYGETNFLVSPAMGFVSELVRNSGASLRSLQLQFVRLTKETIDAIAQGCPHLRRLDFAVMIGEVEPATIRSLMGCIVDSSGELTLGLRVLQDNYPIVAYNADRVAEFEALGRPETNLPAGVKFFLSQPPFG